MSYGQAMKDTLDAQWERGRASGLREVLVMLDMYPTHSIPGHAALLDNLIRKVEDMLKRKERP